MRLKLPWLLVLPLLIGPASAARGANPKVSLKVRVATLAEAARALEQTAGIPIEVRIPEDPRFPKPAVDPGERMSFDWSEVPFGRALRELGTRYGLSVTGRAGGGCILMVPHSGYRPQAYRPAGQVEHARFRIGIRHLTVQRQRTPTRADGTLSLGLSIESEDRDVAAIWGVENLTARDNRGAILVADVHRSWRGGAYLPDAWTDNFGFPAPHSAATQLDWLEGDLIVYRRLTPVRFEFALPLPEDGRRQDQGDLRIEVLRLQPGRAPAPQDPIEAQHAGPEVMARLRFPNGLDLHSRNGGGGCWPLLVGASGRTYSPNGTRSGHQVSPDGVSTWEMTYRFPAIEEPVVRVVFDLLRREEPERLFSFRLKNVPLPQDGAAGSGGAWIYGAAKESSGTPLHRKGGAILVSRVTLHGTAAADGTLWIGLSSQAADAEPGIEWYELEVGKGGLARLPDLRPGPYRVLRLYRPAKADPFRQGPAGWWKGGETTVTLSAGKEAVLPPLQWTPADPPPGTKN